MKARATVPPPFEGIRFIVEQHVETFAEVRLIDEEGAWNGVKRMLTEFLAQHPDDRLWVAPPRRKELDHPWGKRVWWWIDVLSA